MFTLLADWQSDNPEASDLEVERMLEAHRRYDEYLRQNRDRFPTSAFGYAAAGWRNNFSDHRAPHDSWVSQIRFVDSSLPDPASPDGRDLEILLLGAYHDGHLHLRYRNVQSFAISAAGLIEIYRDEVRLSDCGRVLHEIEFLGSDNWIIVAEDIDWEWRELGGTNG